MYGQVDIVRLAHGGDLLGFGEPGANAQVNARVVDQLFFDYLADSHLELYCSPAARGAVVRARRLR